MVNPSVGSNGEAPQEPAASFWSSRTVLVTGAGGFIGSHLVETLLNLKARVCAFVRYNSRRDSGLLKLLPADLLSGCEIIFGDLRDSDAVDKACSGVDTVFHLGALIGIPYSYVHPREVVDTNVTGTLNILMSAQRHGIKKIVHTSTSEVYGTALYSPFQGKTEALRIRCSTRRTATFETP